MIAPLPDPDDSGATHVPSARSHRGRILKMALMAAFGCLYLILGLVYRQVIQGEFFVDQHERQIRHATILPGSRGRIYDRNGYILADNQVRWSVNVDLGRLRGPMLREQRRLVAQARATNPGQKPDTEALLVQARLNVVQKLLDEVNQALSTRRKPVNLRVDAKALALHVRDRRGFPFPVIPDLGTVAGDAAEKFARFVEQMPSDDILSLRHEIVRVYPYGESAAHVIGYVRERRTVEGPGPMSADDSPAAKEAEIRRRLSEQYNLGVHSFTNDRVMTGEAGIELAFESVLAGTSGYQIWERNIQGYSRKLLGSKDPKQGTHLNLSIDIEIQREAERLLNQQSKAGLPLAGAAIMMDVQSGEILALATAPTFDPNRMIGRVSSDYYDSITDKGGWLNRASQGLYPPGSTFKLITAIAGLRSRVVRHDTVLDCEGSLMIGNRAFPEHTPEGYGPTDLEKMLIVSCNVWNYQVGLWTGIDRLANEAHRFGLDAPLLISQVDGKPEFREVARNMIIPTPAVKLKRENARWSEGDTANTSIGQGLMRTTPLHMAAFTASLARNETRTNLTLLLDPGAEAHHRGSEPIGLTAAQRRAIVDGMTRCVEEGTAGPLRIPGLSIAAKTGTAEYQKDGQKAHLAWTLGFAPADNPRVAFVVCIEGEDMTSWGGATAGPVAKGMLLAWLKREMPGTAIEEEKAEEPTDTER